MTTLKETINKRLTAFGLELEDPLKEYVSEEIVQNILNLTNQPKLPKELNHIVAKMVCDFATPKVDPNATSEVNPLDGVKSIKVGDVTMELASGSSHTSSVGADEAIQTILNDYQSQILAFRKLRW